MPVSRLLNKIYANLSGYFWLPCPICGRMFGGHECSDSVLMKTETSGNCVCKNCGQKADELNIEKFSISKRIIQNKGTFGSKKKGSDDVSTERKEVTYD